MIRFNMYAKIFYTHKMKILPYCPLCYKLDHATGQLFFIIDTPSRKFSDPIIHLTGSFGNLYKITFTSTNISCSCDNSYNLCKHILHILSLLWCQLNHGLVKIFPIKVITLIHSNIFNLHILDDF